MESVSSGADRSGILSRQQQGAKRERQARQLLQTSGLRFVAANVRYRTGEIDLIMRDRQVWVFVEVRYRRDARFGAPPPASPAVSSRSCCVQRRCG